MNPLEEIGHDVEVAAKDVAHVIVESVEFPAKLSKVLDTAKTEYPKIRADLKSLDQQGKSIFVDGVAAAGAKGLNWVEDVQIVTDITKFAEQFKSFAADVDAAYAEINADVA